MKPYIKQFANAVYGTNAELALASFNEQKFLKDATSKIVTLEAENAKMRDVVEAAKQVVRIPSQSNLMALNEALEELK